MKELFKNRNFLRYFIADNLAKVSDNYFFIFLSLLALQQTSSPAQVGGLLMANAIPRLVLMLFGGNLADRVAPQVILRLGNIVQGAGLAFILLGLVSGSLPMLGLYLLAIIFGAVDAFSAPASISAIPRIVPRAMLLKANSLVQGTEMVSFTSGVLLAGLVMQVSNLEVAAAVNIVLYTLAAILFFTVRLNFHTDDAEAREGSELQRIMAGLKYVWKKPVLRANTLLLAATNLAFSGPISIGLLFIVTEKMGLGPAWYTGVFAVFGVGVLIGAVLMSLVRSVKGPGRIIVLDYILSGVGFISFAFMTNIWIMTAVCLALGILGGIANAVSATWTQLNTKPALLGRVGAVTMIAALAFDPFSQGLSGLVAEWSLEGLFIIAGAFIIVMTLIVVRFNTVLLSREPLQLKTEQTS